MEPLKLKAPLKDYLWGGHRLKQEYGKETDLEKVAESWELSCHKDGMSVIADGPCAGLTLPEYAGRYGKSVFGSHCAPFRDFPMLIKLIDAEQNLSVQVHPDNDYALRVEGEYGKTEMWVVVDAREGASLIYGVNRTLTREEFASRIQNNTLLEVCNYVPVHPGDVFFIEAGTLHAIGAGILIAEIQQNSNSTYRVYDYGRLGADGKPRQLHIKKALDVTRLSPLTRKPGPAGQPEQVKGAVRTLLGSSAYFTAYRLEADGSVSFEAGGESFHSLLMLQGEGTLAWNGGSRAIQKGDSFFLPAGLGAYRLEGRFTAIQSMV